MDNASGAGGGGGGMRERERERDRERDRERRNSVFVHQRTCERETEEREIGRER